MDDDPVLDVYQTSCCVVGGGPGGLMLALLLARRGVPVTLLEAHPTFDRDFRGDTIHPGILEILDSIGLAERLHDLPHVKVHGPTLNTASGATLAFDLRKLLKTPFPYLLWVAQPVFLDFLAAEARAYPTFRLVMGANVRRLVMEDGILRGVRYRSSDGWHEVRAPLTVAADGRFSQVRKLMGIRPIPTSSPVELLWFRLPRLPSDPPGTGIISPRFGKGQVMLMIDRADHWQVGYFLPTGRYARLRTAGIEAMKRNIVGLEPRFAPNVEHLTDWHQFSLLSVASSRCRRWYRPGMLLIGDSAHTMTPAAGSGIKYAIEDAVEACNVLAGPLLQGKVRLADLREVQRRREWPTRIIQAFGAVGLRGLARQLRSAPGQGLPRIMPLVFRMPLLGRLLAFFLAFGIRKVKLTE